MKLADYSATLERKDVEKCEVITLMLMKMCLYENSLFVIYKPHHGSLSKRFNLDIDKTEIYIWIGMIHIDDMVGDPI